MNEIDKWLEELVGTRHIEPPNCMCRPWCQRAGLAAALLGVRKALDAAARRYHIYAGPHFANVDPPHTELFKDCASPHCTGYKSTLADTKLEELLR